MNILAVIEHTRLKADTTFRHVEGLCAEAVEHGFACVCINPVFVPLASQLLRGSKVGVVTVVGFPLGAGSDASDVRETEWVLEQGAREVDMVIPIGLALSGDLQAVTQRVLAVRQASKGAILKVILECGFFDEQQLLAVAGAARDGHPDYLKTATGFGPRGASAEDVKLLCKVAGSTAAVKASGGIRNLADATRLLQAGATRLGTSSGVQISNELRHASESARES
jgi:deoxyribose-phosphate aldolase